jgi:hypothetical protein
VYSIIFFIIIQHQLAGIDGIVFPALRQYLPVTCCQVLSNEDGYMPAANYEHLDPMAKKEL